jgi:mono/diheme cytochrome c family protein
MRAARGRTGDVSMRRQQTIRPIPLGVLTLVLALGCNAPHTDSSHAREGAPAADKAAPPAIVSESHIAAGGALPAGATLTNPYAGDSAAATAGAALFTSMNCDGCHGGGATGWVGPSLADGRWRYGGSASEIFTSIYYGRRYGMPAFGGLMPKSGIWRIVTYLQSLPLPNDVPTESWK